MRKPNTKCICDNRILAKVESKKISSNFCLNCFGDIKIIQERIYKIDRIKARKYSYGNESYVNLGGRERTRMIVRLRDDFTCQDCKKFRTPDMAKSTGKRLFDIHHLNNLCGKKSRKYDKVSEIDGLITLCHKCHFNRPEHTTKKKAFESFNRLINT